MSVKEIFDSICKLNILEIFELLNKFKKKFNLNLTDNSKKKKVEKKFSISIKSLGNSKIMIIKLIRDITKLDLINSKKIIDNLPCNLKNNLNKNEALEIKKKFEKLGCVVELDD
ncbi:ribosomal protein L7/L12 [Candidatus Vidania fulgoroideorum]